VLHLANQNGSRWPRWISPQPNTKMSWASTIGLESNIFQPPKTPEQLTRSCTD